MITNNHTDDQQQFESEIWKKLTFSVCIQLDKSVADEGWAPPETLMEGGAVGEGLQVTLPVHPRLTHTSPTSERSHPAETHPAW